MKRELCTLCDVNYLPRALVLYRSLEQTSARFRLRIFCMDTATEEILGRLELPNLVAVPLRELERRDPALASVKDDRTAVEYCWTATPAVCLYALETEPELTEITYVDADVMFFSDPEPLFAELGDDAVLIVPHRYAPEHRYKEATSGTYNVEWLTFRRDADGLAALRWWHDRCIEWCYFRYEDGKMGDQKYLDDWPERFDRVHVLQTPAGGLAPWNVTNHELHEEGGRVVVDGVPLVFYHYHSLRLYRRTAAARAAMFVGYLRRGVAPARLPWQTNYAASPIERRLVWAPYLRMLGEQVAAVGAVAPGRVPGVESFPAREVAGRALRGVARRGKRKLAAAWRIAPVRLVPGSLTRYRDSWRSRDVAGQMVELTDRQLGDPESVAPYRSFKELLRELVDAPGLRRPARFLDIGCGAGAYGELLERWAPGRFEYIGADYSAEIVAAARERAPGRRFVQIDVFDPGALDGFDVVFASALVDVLPDYERALAALLAADAPFVMVHRQRVGRRSRAEIAPGYAGQRTYRSYVTREQLETLAAAQGRSIIAETHVDGDVHSFLFVRR